MRTKYQRAFDHVAASHRLKEEVRNMTKQERRALHRQVPKTLLAAVLVVLLLAGTALAVSTPGIQDWFRQYWQEATGQTKMDKGQAAAVDGLTQSVGSQAAGQEREEDVIVELPGAVGEETAPAAGPESGTSSPASREENAAGPEDTAQSPAAEAAAAASEVTVTVDSVTAGKSNLWILLHVSGDYQPGKHYSFWSGWLEGAPEKSFEDVGIVVSTGIIFSRDNTRVREDGSLEMLVRYESPDPTADLTESRDMTLELEDLRADGEVLVKGRWEVPISLSATETQPPLVLENVTLPLTEDGVTRQVTYQKVEVTSTGVQLTCAPQDWKNALAFYDMVLVLKDGSEVATEGGRANWVGEADVSPYVGSFAWKMPVDLDQAAALRFRETTVPLA